MKREMRWLAILCAFLLCMAPAMAEMKETAQQGEPEQLEEISQEEARAGVELLLNAAAGLDFADNYRQWRALEGEELAARQREMAVYRANMRVFLLEALCPQDENWALPEDGELALMRDENGELPEDGELALVRDENGELPEDGDLTLMQEANEALAEDGELMPDLQGENTLPEKDTENEDLRAEEIAEQGISGEEILPVIAQTAQEAFAHLSETEPGREYLEKMAELGCTDAQSCLEMTRKWVGAWLLGIDGQALREINDDYAYWLLGPQTKIDYPVVQGEDNDFYLNRLFNGRRNSCGTLFVDYRNLPDLQDPNTLIYGHHMRNDSMFGSLTDYEQNGYFEAHPYLLMVTDGEVYLLEALAGYTTSRDDHCYDIAISGDEDFAAFVEEARAKSDFESQVEAAPGDRLVTLSTCAYAFENARYILIARLTPVAARIEAETADGLGRAKAKTEIEQTKEAGYASFFFIGFTRTANRLSLQEKAVARTGGLCKNHADVSGFYKNNSVVSILADVLWQKSRLF